MWMNSDPSQLEMGKQGVIFYIVEEAVNNARKHAAAPVIAVNLRPMEAGIALLEIADNGVGFDVKAVTQAYDKRAHSSLGMVNLRERAELVNGVLQIDSAPGQGTKVQVYIPLTEEATDRLHHPAPGKNKCPLQLNYIILPTRQKINQRPPVILIHGAGGTHLSWPPQIRRLSDEHIFAIDLPGHGKSGGAGRQSIDEYADDVIAFMKDLRSAPQ